MPPVSITGIARYRQPERFRFKALAGQTLTFEVRAQRLGSPVDSILRILDSAGKPLAVNDDAQFAGVEFNKDSRIRHTFINAGEYSVEMRNLSAVTGENHPYQLVIREPNPGFELMLDSDQPYVYAQDTATFKITAVRNDGFEDAIHVGVAEPISDMAVEAGEIPRGSNKGELRVRAGDIAPGTYRQVILSAGDQSAWRSVRIASGGGEGATYGRVQSATLVVAEKPDFSLEAALTNVNLVRGGSVDIPLIIRRREGFTQPIRFSAVNLPSGVTLNAVETKGDSIALKLVASPTALPARAARVAILGTADGERFEQAPKIAVVVD